MPRYGRSASLSWAARSPDIAAKPTGDADTLANRLGGQRMALRRLEIDESRAIALYGQQLKDLDDEPSITILRHVIEEEREHYRELSSLIRQRYPSRPHEAEAPEGAGSAE